MFYKFCPRCGSSLKIGRPEPDKRERLVCIDCRFIFYQNPKPAAGVIAVRDKDILLVQRRLNPGAGDWSLPAGFIEMDESPAEAAVRETREETGMDVRVKKLFDVTGTCEHLFHHVILVLYEVRIIGGALRANDDAMDARFFPLDHLPSNIAFPSHRRAIEKFKQEKYVRSDI